MPDETSNPPAGADAGKPASGGTTPAAEAPNKAGDDERLALRERAIAAERKAAKLEDAQKKADDARLAEQGKYQELAKAKEAEANDWKAKYTQAQRESALVAAGAKAGIKDASDLVLARLGDVDVSDIGALREAAEVAVSDLAKSKPYLFGSSTKNGTPHPTPLGNPGGDPVKVPKVSAGEVANLTREQKQAIADGYFKGGNSGFFGRK